MAYAFIHGEVKGSGASVEFKGNGLDLLDLTIQIVGSVVAEVPEPLRPYVIKKIQDKIPDAVQNDLEAQGKAAPAEKKEKPPVGETVGFRMARQFAETEPGFKDFMKNWTSSLQERHSVVKAKISRSTFSILNFRPTSAMTRMWIRWLQRLRLFWSRQQVGALIRWKNLKWWT